MSKISAPAPQLRFVNLFNVLTAVDSPVDSYVDVYHRLDNHNLMVDVYSKVDMATLQTAGVVAVNGAIIEMYGERFVAECVEEWVASNGDRHVSVFLRTLNYL